MRSRKGLFVGFEEFGGLNSKPLSGTSCWPPICSTKKTLSDLNDPLSKESPALDRKIKSICRGC